MTSDADRLVDDYLESLSHELRDLPRRRRHEITEEIAGHIAEARADLDAESEAGIRNVLERLGDPTEIAAESRDRFSVRRRQTGVIEILALIGLLVGGLVLPVIGWFIGLVLLWVSAAWTTREKLVGTFVIPGGLSPGLFLLVFGLYGEACSRLYQDGNLVSESCTEASDLLGIAGLSVIILLLVAPIVTIAFLALRLRRAAPSSYQPSPGSA